MCLSKSYCIDECITNSKRKYFFTVTKLYELALDGFIDVMDINWKNLCMENAINHTELIVIKPNMTCISISVVRRMNYFASDIQHWKPSYKSSIFRCVNNTFNFYLWLIKL